MSKPLLKSSPFKANPELKEAFRNAIEYYGFKSFNAFFYASAVSLVEQHKRGDSLLSPLRFQHNEYTRQPP